MSKRVGILGLLLGLSAVAWAADRSRSARVLVDRPRLEQKLRRATDALQGARERLRQDDAVMKELLDEAQSQIEQARAQLASERSADAWLEQQLEAERSAPPPDSGTPVQVGAALSPGSLRTSEPYTSGHNLEAQPAPTSAPLPAGREPLGEVGMRALINAMRGQEFRSGKMQVLAQAVPAYVFTVSQIVELLNEFNAPGDRLEVLTLTVPHLADKESLPRLFRACSNENERERVRQLVES